MSLFLKLLGKEEIKYFRTEKQCFNPPKKSQINPKSLLIELPKKITKRKFGKQIQNVPNLTDKSCNIFFNQKKRNRNENNIIPISKMNIKNKEAKFHPKKIFKIINDNNINNININNNSNIEEKINKTSININESTELNEFIENKENIPFINQQNIIKKDDKNNNSINYQENKSSNKNNNNIKIIEIDKNFEKGKDNNNDIINIKNKEREKNELKIIKINIFPNINNILEKEKNKEIRHNLQRAKEYLEEIHQYLKEVESNNLAITNYMSLIQTDINEKMRIILINWLIEVHFKFNMVNETLFICINIIDRYLSQKNINRKYLQLLGITSLFIASKYEEIYAPSAKDLIYMTDNAYKIEEMIKMENEILCVLKFDLTFPTSLRFLELYGDFLNLDEINFFRCYYLNEVSLISYNLCGFCPSLIACACLYINLKSNIRLFKGYNEEKLFSITGYKITEIKNCLNLLLNELIKIEEPNNKFISVKKKYSIDKYRKVSNDHYFIETDEKFG